jgi:hypothetical protein
MGNDQFSHDSNGGLLLAKIHGSPGGSAITAPLPCFRFLSPIGPNGIKDNIPAQFEKIAVFIDNDCLVPPLDAYSDEVGHAL